jgi:hypothetical protein
MPNEPDVAPACIPDAHGHCAVCADEGILALVVSVEPGGTARVRVGTVEQIVALDLVDNVRAGDSILVHLGFAIARLESHE